MSGEQVDLRSLPEHKRITIAFADGTLPIMSSSSSSDRRSSHVIRAATSRTEQDTSDRGRLVDRCGEDEVAGGNLARDWAKRESSNLQLQLPSSTSAPGLRLRA